MNDLTFGATLLSCLVSLAIAVVVELNGPAQAKAAVVGGAVGGPDFACGQLAEEHRNGQHD